ncbi:SpoIID/LytB domain-containing protein [bacterium]
MLFSKIKLQYLNLKNKTIILKPINKNIASFIIEEIEFAKGHPWAGKEDRQYRGEIELRISNKGITMINIVNAEEYLYSVLSSEMMAWWPYEALKAQAIIARSYLFHKKKYSQTHKNQGFDLCESQHCQVYKGISSETKQTNRAVNATRGEILTYKNRVINALYHSNCGGHTQGSVELKGWYDQPYLSPVFDGYSNTVFPSTPFDLELWIKSKPIVYGNQPSLKYPPSFRWFRVIPAKIMQEKLNRTKKIGRIKKIIPIKKNSSGNLGYVKVIGTKGELHITKENQIRRLFGLGPLRSTLFWLETRFAKKNHPVEFIIYGGGWGHGVGMCQTGSAGMALKGFSYKKILSHYYKGTKWKKLKY